RPCARGRGHRDAGEPGDRHHLPVSGSADQVREQRRMSELAAARPDLTARIEPRGRRGLPPVLIMLCFLFVAALTLWAIFGSRIAPHDANAPDLLGGIQNPSWSHPLGTDTLGRDVFSRVIVGARTAMVGPLLIALGAMFVGNALGVTAGYLGGTTDFVIMRWADLMFALPTLLVAIVVVGVLGGGYWIAVLLLMLLTVPYDARLIRGSVLEQRPRACLEAAPPPGP